MSKLSILYFACTILAAPAQSPTYNVYPFMKNPTNLLASDPQVPFNISIPWDYQIASFLNIHVDELRSKYKKDKSLRQEIGSVCTMIRDYSIKYMFTQSNAYSNIVQVKELCYGRGWTMINGKSYPTGLCERKLTKEDKSVKVVVEDNQSEFGQRGQCKVRKPNGYVPNLNAAESRDGFLRNYLDRKLHKQYLSGLKLGGTPGKYFFKQLVSSANIKASSNVAVPNYLSGNTNGKGYSFNPTPKDRFDNGARPELFKTDAYGASDGNFINKNMKKTWKEVKQALKEEDNFLSGIFGSGKGNEYKGTQSHNMMQMKDVPDYFCNVFCSSLDIDEVINGIVENESKDKKMFKKNTTHFYSPLADEQTMLNYNNNVAGSNPYDQQQIYKLYNGTHECERTEIDVDMCVGKGKEISEWFMQRILNPGVLCDYEAGNCNMLYKA